MSGIVQDLRYALRQLRKSPAFTISAVLTLAMAIGANLVVFSVINGLIVRPLNVPQPESLYSVQRTSRKDTNQSYPDYLDLRDRNHSFEDLVAYSISQVALDTGESPTPTWSLETSGNYFDALRSPISAVISTPPTKTALTAPLTWCSVTPIGTPVFMMIVASWGVSSR
jgi:hypothetical protein